MTILNVVTDTIGQSGQIPKIIYINTNNTASQVQTPGFLDPLISQGIQINATQIAVITTKETPSAPEVANIYTIAVSHSGVITLTAVAGGSSSDSWTLQGNADAPSDNYLGTTTPVELTIGTDGVDVILISSGQDVAIGNANTIAINAGTDLTLASSGTLVLDAATSVAMPGLHSSTTSNILYYGAGGIITEGPVPGGGSDWNLTATNSGSGLLLGVNTADTWSIQQNSIPFLTLATGNLSVATNSAVSTMTLGNSNLTGQFNANNLTISTGVLVSISTGAGGFTVTSNNGNISLSSSRGTIGLLASNGNLSINTGTVGDTITVDGIPGANALVYLGAAYSSQVNIGSSTCTTNIHGPTVQLSALSNVTTSNAVYYNTTSGLLTYGAAGSGSAGWNLTGTNSGGTLLLGTNDTTGFSIQQNSIPFFMLGTGILTIATNTAITTFNIGNTSASTTMDGTSLFIPNLPNTTTASVLYYNSGTGRLSFGLAPSGAAGWNLTGTNSGSGLLLGTNTTDSYSLQQNSIPFITLATAALSIGTNTGVTTLTIGSSVLVTAWSFNGLSALGTGHVELGTASGNADFGTMAGASTFNGTSVQVKADGGNLDLLIADGNVLNVNGSGGSAGTMNIATNLIGTLNIGAVATTTSIDGTHLYTPNLFSNTTSNVVFYDISTKQLSYGPAGSSSSAWLTTGNSSLASGAYLGVADSSQPLIFKTNNITFMSTDATQNVAFTANTLLLSSSSALAIETTGAGSIGINTVSGGITLSAATADMHINAGTTMGIGSSGQMALSSALGISVAAPNVNINTGSFTNVTTLGNVLSGNNININSANLYINNLQSTPTYVPTTSMQVMIDVGASNIAYLTAPGWSTGGDAGVTGGKLGTTDAQSWQMIVDNFAFFTVTSAVDITFGGNTFHVAIANGGNSISFFNNYDTAGTEIILAVGAATPSSITLLPDSLSAVAKGMTFTSSTDDIAFISSAASISSSSVNTYHTATTAINQVAPTFNFGITTVNTNINIGSLTTTAFLIQGTTTNFTMGGTCTFSTGNFNLMSTEINLNASTFLNMSGNVASIWTFTDTLLIDVTQTLTIGSNSGNLLLTGITGVYIDGRNGVLALGNLNAIAPGPGIYTLVWTQSSTLVGFGPLAVAAFAYALATSTSQAIVNGIGYVTANPSLITFSLPSSPNLGDRFQVLGDSGGPWTIQQNALQSIWVANSQSTVGVGGSVSSQAANGSDCIGLVYTQNGVWRMESFAGNFVIV